MNADPPARQRSSRGYRLGYLWLALLVVGLHGYGFLLFTTEGSRAPSGTPEELFTKFVMPPPAGLKILTADYRPGREWLVVFHLSGSPESIDAIVKHENLDLIDPDSPRFKRMRENANPAFKGFEFAEGEAANTYEEYVRDKGLWIQMWSNSTHSEAFLVKRRQ